MNTLEYENAVIELLKGGQATEAMWKEAAKAVSRASDADAAPEIDAAIEADVDCD